MQESGIIKDFGFSVSLAPFAQEKIQINKMKKKRKLTFKPLTVN
jgi:hypothetical protein